MMGPKNDVQIPGKAVLEGTDVGLPTRTLLRELNLLGAPEENENAHGFTALFTGPPQSVALIEAGATAATKWWATGLSALVIAGWGNISTWWPDQELSNQVAVLAGASFVTAILVAAIAYLIASDVRGRAIATVSIVEARATVARAMIQAAQAAHAPTPAEFAKEIIPLPKPLPAKLLKGKDSDGWRATAMERQPDGLSSTSSSRDHPRKRSRHQSSCSVPESGGRQAALAMMPGPSDRVAGHARSRQFHAR